MGSRPQGPIRAPRRPCARQRPRGDGLARRAHPPGRGTRRHADAHRPARTLHHRRRAQVSAAVKFGSGTICPGGTRRHPGEPHLVHSGLAAHRRPAPRTQSRRRSRIRPRPRRRPNRGRLARSVFCVDTRGSSCDRRYVLCVPRGAARGRRVRRERPSPTALARRRRQRRRTTRVGVPHRAIARHGPRRRRRRRRRSGRVGARRDRASRSC